jgi:outer membrane protein OmpA-like peptidoglycan-associated protein
VVEHALALHLDAATSFVDRVNLSGTLPITLLERGTSAEGVVPLDGAAVADPRVGLFVRVFGQPDRSVVSLSVGGHIWIPIGAENRHQGDAGVRGLPKVIVGGLVKDHLRWTFNAGVLIRDTARISSTSIGTGNTVGTELQLGAGLAYVDRPQRLHAGLELNLATILVDDHAFKEDYSSLELLAGVHYLIKELFLVGVAGGFGTLREPGTPDGRFILRVAYAPRKKPAPVEAAPPPPPPPRDRDGDGIPDVDDACPDQPGPASTDPFQNGCPPKPADRDHDGVPDAEDLCPDEPAGATPDPNRRGCPLPKDSDGDGVPDDKDVCPTVPAGAHPDSKRPGCPATDRDLDNVYDDVDACPDNPGVPNADPAKNGCPLPDRDKDGIPDELDACPDKPGMADPDAKKNGCPRIRIRMGTTTILQPVFFATNQDVILPQSFPMLQAVAASLASQPHIKLVAIEGHADDRGGAGFNLELSQRRAESIVKYLVEHGVAANRLEAKGFGATRPVSEHRDEHSRSLNRRVEFRIVKQDKP